MSNAHQTSTSFLLKFSSSSLTTSDIHDARSGEVVYRLRSSRTPDTVLIDHGGFIGVKSTCVNRLSTILCDVSGNELGRVSWDADGRPIRMWLTEGDTGRHGRVLPRLCGEDAVGDDSPRVISGWDTQTPLRAMWRAHHEGAAMLAGDDLTRMLALYSPNMVRGLDGAMTPADTARGENGNSFLRLWVTPADVVETVVSAIITEASRRFVFNLGSLDPTPVRPAMTPKASRPSLVGRISGLMRRSNSDSSDSGLSSPEDSVRSSRSAA